MAAITVSGEAIALEAYALPPLNPTGLGARVEAVSILIAIVTSIAVGLRVWVRTGYSVTGSRLWGIDDYLLLIGFLPFLPSIVFATYAVHYGVGLQDTEIPSPYYQIRAAEYIIYWELLYFVSSTIVKCAIAFTCIRIDQRRRITYPIVTNMTIMVITAFLAMLFVFANCRPLAATWNPYLGTCQKEITLETVSYIVSSIQMATDWNCAVIPWFIVARLQLSRRKKISVLIILGLGVLASIATCIRMPYLKYYDTTAYPDHFLYHVGVIVICSNVECSLGIIACSLPPLRKLFKYYYASSNGTSDSSPVGNPESYDTKLVSLMPGGARAGAAQEHYSTNEWSRLEDDDSSGKGIMRHTNVHASFSRE